MTEKRLVLSLVILCTLMAAAQTKPNTAVQSPSREVQLQDGWAIRSGCETKAAGPAVSTVGFREEGWLATTVPNTVMAAQVNAGVIKDPFFGKNLLDVPGMNYPRGKVFSRLPAPENSPYRCQFWYRKEFVVPAAWDGAVWLRFNGINYRANIWVNGELVAAEQQVRGAYRSYEFDVTKFVHRGKRNAVAVETFMQTENDLGINWVDWNPSPADKNLGLWRDVWLVGTGAVTLRNPAVITHFSDDALSAAELTLVADVENQSNSATTATVHAAIGAAKVQQQVQLGPREKKIVRFAPEQFAQLRIAHPAVWWPYQYGKPALYDLHMSIAVNGRVSDEKWARVGLREVDGKINDKGALQFRVNRKTLLIRGGGWAPDMFYREPKERLRQEFQYVRDMNLNAIRLEGKMGSENLFDLADEMGILVMAGWCCCDMWEMWDKWTPEHNDIAMASLYSQISRLRSHPSVFVWLNGSDNPPPENVEQGYIAVLKERDWQNPFVSSATQRPTTVTGPSGVKMTGPYDYVPPEFWLIDKEQLHKDMRGGGYSFNTETGPGPAIPLESSIKRTLPKESWWPIDDTWNYHAGGGEFAQYNIFNGAMTAMYGEPKNLNDYVRKAQLMAYDGERAMFEAYAANKYTSTGVIQWMLNNAWPSFIWHLYDYYLVPGGGYFGTKKANEPIHAMYRYDDRKVAVISALQKPYSGLKLTARLFSVAGEQLFTQDATIDVPADGVTTAFAIPQQQATTLLRLELRGADGKLLSENVYAVPSTLAEFEWEKSTFFYTPSTYANMRDLDQMPKADVRAVPQWHSARAGTLRLTNTGKSIAFMVRARLTKGVEEDVAPVFWSDNYITLLPGETRELKFEVPGAKARPDLRIDGWNVEARAVKASGTAAGEP